MLSLENCDKYCMAHGCATRKKTGDSADDAGFCSFFLKADAVKPLLVNLCGKVQT